MIYLAFALVAFLSFFIGHYLRELKDILLTVKNRIQELHVSQEKDKTPTTGFAEPMTRAEAAADLEKERIDLLNP